MKIKHILTLFCVTLTLVFLLASCADTSGAGNGETNMNGETNTDETNGDGGDGDGDGGDGDEPEYTGPFEASNVSARQCNSSVSPLSCFISVWNTENSGGGASATNTIVLPLVSGGTYDFYVNWGDGEDVEKITSSADATHTYTTPGEYTIYIAGDIKGWRFYVAENSYGDAVKLLNVTQWGSLSLGNTAGSQFYGAETFNPSATDAPDVSETTSLVSAFNGASNFNADISDWDVSQVTTMKGMFLNASSFNNNGKPLDWGSKTSKVTDMQEMFFTASSFNQDISSWNVSEVTYMNYMFWNAEAFNNNGMVLDWGIKTSKVTDMRFMFNGASAFNQNICEWDVNNVTDYDPFANDSALANEHNPFHDDCTSTKSK